MTRRTASRRSGSSACVGHLIRDARVADLGLGADDALGERGRGREKRARDLLGRQAADFAQGECHLRVGGERGVAAGEDQAQPIVFDAFLVGPGGGVVHRELLGGALFVELIESGAAAEAVDRLEPAGGHQPGARVCGHSFLRPLLERGAERVLQGFFGDVEVAEQADERGQNPT